MTERLGRAIVRCASRLVPASRRARWRDEWDAELSHAWRSDGRSRPSRRRRAELTWRAAASVRHAAGLRIGGWRVDDVGRDVMAAMRFARRQPVVVATAVATIALGVGANATIFSVVNAVFLRPSPIGHPADVVSVFTTDAAYQERVLPVSYLNFIDYRDSGIFKDLAAELRLDLTLGERGQTPERLSGALVSPNYFDVLGLPPRIGRAFLQEEAAPLDAHPVAVISSSLWHRRFASAPDVVGRQVAINNLPYTIVGVAPDGFRGPTLLASVDLWLPIAQRRGIVGYLAPWFDARQALMCAVYGRLRDASARDRTATAMRALSDRLAAQYPKQNHARRAELIPIAQAGLNPNLRGQVVRMGWFLTIVSGLLLALGCATVANLLLLRALGRRREIAIRIATGATRGRLIRQMLSESLFLALAGGALGLLVAAGSRQLLWAFKPPAVPDTFVVPFDYRVWLYTLAITALTGVIFGLVPALQASRSDVIVSLKGRGHSAPARAFGWKNTLVVSQVALSLMLLVGTGLVLRSLDHAERMQPGIAADHLIVLNMNPDSMGYDKPRALALFRRVIESVDAVPGVASAAFAFNRPLAPAISALFYLEGKDAPSPHDGAPIATNAADVNYFQTAGIALDAGRNFTERDTPESEPSIIINRSVQRRFFAPGESAVGTRMRFVDVPTAFRIVGIVADSTYGALGEETPNYFYYPFQQVYGAGEVTLYVRTSAAPEALVAPVRRAVQTLDPTLPLYNVGLVSDLVSRSLWAPKTASALLVTFGVLGLVLAAVGTYGVMAFHVDQSRQEIGIRMALGQGRASILGRVIAAAMRLVFAGLLVGLAAAAATTHLIASFLYDLSATDAATFTIAPLVLVVAAFGAALIPARRATAIDPLRVLKSE